MTIINQEQAARRPKNRNSDMMMPATLLYICILMRMGSTKNIQNLYYEIFVFRFLFLASLCRAACCAMIMMMMLMILNSDDDRSWYTQHMGRRRRLTDWVPWVWPACLLGFVVVLLCEIAGELRLDNLYG